MGEREYDLVDYFKNALDKIEGGSTNIFLLKQDLERIIEWKTERDTLKEQLSISEPTKEEKEEMAQAYRERAKEDLELCDTMSGGPQIRALEAKVVTLEAEYDKLKAVNKLLHQTMDDGTTLLVAQNNKMNVLESRLARADGLLLDHYPCYDENKCKNCVGDFGEIDYRTCAGYNVLTALRGEAKK